MLDSDRIVLLSRRSLKPHKEQSGGEKMRWQWLLIVLAVLVLLLLAYAWIDGGREPVHTITEPVAVPEMAG